MSASTKGSGLTWVGRSIRRLEDPALVAGRGNFTADLPAVHWIRFVRSPVASGRIERIGVPPGADVITAADLAGIKRIKPMLHKFNYIPVTQPVLATDVVRFVGELVAAVVAPSKEEAEDIADRVEVEMTPLAAVTDARRALGADAPIVHPEAPANVIVEGRIKTPNFDATRASAHTRVKFEARSCRQNATPLEARAGHAAYDAATGRVTLTCTTQMPHLTRTAIADVLNLPESDLRVIAPDVGGGFGQKMSLPPEYVILVWLARRLRSSVAWTEDRRENLMAGFHSRDQVIFNRWRVRQGGQAYSAFGRHRRQCRCLLLLSDDLRSRAADGHGGAAGPLSGPGLRLRGAWRRHAHLPNGALSGCLPTGDHIRSRTINGQGGRPVWNRSYRNPSPQFDRSLSLQIGRPA